MFRKSHLDDIAAFAVCIEEVFMEFFYCYGYGRLSREDYQRTGVRDESNSIKNQRDLIHKFVSDRPELQLVMEGYDDGYMTAC